MDPTTTHPAGVAAGGPPPAPPGPVGVGAPPGKSTPEQRARWREKSRQAYLRRKARENGQPDPVPADPVVAQPAADPAASPPAGPPAVPWDPSVLEPLFRTVVPEIERLDIAALKARATPLGVEVVNMVEKDATWNPVAKGTIVTTGPAVVAKALNSVGVSAEHAPAIALVGAVAAILTGRQMLAAKLDELAKAERAPSTPPPTPPNP